MVSPINCINILASAQLDPAFSLNVLPIYGTAWLRSTVGGTPVFGRRTDRPALGLQPTGNHYVGIPSATGQPTRPTQPFILPGSINE